MMPFEPADDALALYVHWPFCLSKCPYCDFNSHVERAVDAAAWRHALLAELDHFARLAPGRRLETVFFGGGTPSLMAPETVAAVIERASRHWPPAGEIEVTLEANPTSVEAGKLAAFRAAGVNRVSLGVQALDDAALAALGRGHGVEEALAAVAAARGLFGRVSFDLIYARPGQSRAAWRDELACALGHAAGHLSVYQLTIEPGTAFRAAEREGRLRLPPEGRQAAMYADTQTALEAAGLPAYEVSNHAAPGEECRHNLMYWLSADYVGVGPGAHGRLTRDGVTTAHAQRRSPAAWLAAVEAAGHASEAATPLGRAERIEEIAMMGLRLAAGLPRRRIEALAGEAPETLFARPALDRLVEGGMIELDADGIRATASGRLRLDAVLGALLTETYGISPGASP